MCKLAILSFLFVTIEEAADVVVDGMPHGDPMSHVQEYGHSLDAHGGDLSDSELDGDHCDHCCHGHSSSIAHSGLAPLSVPADEKVEIPYSDRLSDLLLTPPTPPPDALILS